MRHGLGAQTANRLLVAAALVTITAGGASVAAAPPGAGPLGPAAPVVVERVGLTAGGDVAPVIAPAVLSPSDVVRETGSWFAHGYTLDLRTDGTGTFAAWVGAFDGHRIQLRLIPAPGAASVAEVVAVETVGAGALGAEELPGLGGLVTVAVGQPVRTAHVEWSSGPRRLAAELCPVAGLGARQMEALRCGA
ncbi:hypothetical protein [Dietzia sp. CH92]|uniref:hypothetical protein n=1 Tax=Dietzia sp. CH92 TaxID=3051823 RepID=UPI0028D368B8|nr:hypothetical protein [Dietzia sp. CH92]